MKFLRDFLTITYTSPTGSGTVILNNFEVRKEVKYFTGLSSEILTSTEGNVFTLPTKAPAYLEFVIELQERPQYEVDQTITGEAQTKYNILQKLVQESYTANVMFPYFRWSSTGDPGENQVVVIPLYESYQTQNLAFDCVLEIKEDDSYSNQRGEGAVKKTAIIRAYKTENYVLPSPTPDIAGVCTPAQDSLLTTDLTGSTNVQGQPIQVADGIVIEYTFNGIMTARIPWGSDPSVLANWTIINEPESGSFNEFVVTQVTGTGENLSWAALNFMQYYNVAPITTLAITARLFASKLASGLKTCTYGAFAFPRPDFTGSFSSPGGVVGIDASSSLLSTFATIATVPLGSGTNLTFTFAGRYSASIKPNAPADLLSSWTISNQGGNFQTEIFNNILAGGLGYNFSFNSADLETAISPSTTQDITLFIQEINAPQVIPSDILTYTISF